ncbi:hypothetical protein F6B41_34045 [Microbacterium lushaniae]|nr:hypothetical protein F6B41_34045 [Microbacterium lushaniae]
MRVDRDDLRDLTPEQQMLLHVEEGRGHKFEWRLDVRAAADPEWRCEHALLPALPLHKSE